MRAFCFGFVSLAAVGGCSGDGSSPTRDSGAAGATTGGSSGGGSADDAGPASGSPSGAGASSGGASGALVTYGQPYAGGLYHRGPVDYPESQFHNACAPGTMYDPRVRQAEGTMLAGLWNGIPNVADYCDACIWMVTDKGKSAMLRVVTYGQTTTNSVDTSPEAFQILNVGENPRTMTWQFAKCPDTGPMMYEFQTGSNEWWTSLWVRNARVPLSGVEVRSVHHASWTALARGTDGTLTDASGFGAGPFSIRSTGVDGKQIVDTFNWPSAGIAGAFLTGTGNFQ